MSERPMIFVHGANMSGTIDYELICDLLISYGIYDLVVEAAYAYTTRYPSSFVPQIFSDQLTPAINAGHRRGMKVHASFNCLLGTLTDAYSLVTHTGASGQGYTCAKKQISRTLMENLVKELVAFPAQSGAYAGDTIDGIMWDYIRYGEAERQDVCYCPECRAAFEQWLGEGPIADWTPFYPGGTRHVAFLQWRPIPITELVRDMQTWARQVNTNVEISAAVWCPVPTNPQYRVLWLGQDWADWVENGYLDFVSPMIYTTDTSYIQAAMQDIQNYFMRRPIPLIPFMTDCFPATVSPSVFQAEIDAIRAGGSDGWVIWRYGGQGDGTGTAPNLVPYLDLILEGNGPLPPPPDYVTPFSESLDEGTYRITFPSNVLVGADTYNFVQWEDGSTSPVRIVELISDMSILATYELVIPEPEKGDIQVHAFLDGVPVVADGLVVEWDFPFQTTVPPAPPVTIEADPGTYTLRLSFGELTETRVVEVEEGVTIRVDIQFAPPTSKLPLALALSAGVGVALGAVLISAGGRSKKRRG